MSSYDLNSVVMVQQLSKKKQSVKHCHQFKQESAVNYRFLYSRFSHAVFLLQVLRVRLFFVEVEVDWERGSRLEHVKNFIDHHKYLN